MEEKKPGKRGRGAEGKVAVGIAVENMALEGIGRFRLSTLPDVSSVSLETFIENSVATESTIITDSWKSYGGISVKGYRHEICEDPKELALPHLVAFLLNRWLLETYQGAVRQGCRPYYLDEFTFRFNRRASASRGKLFFRLVQLMIVFRFHPSSRCAKRCPPGPNDLTIRAMNCRRSLTLSWFFA